MNRQDTYQDTSLPSELSPFSNKSYKTSSEIVSLREQINLISKMLILSGERERSYQDQINELNKKLDAVSGDASTHTYQLSYNIYVMECRLRALHNDYKYLYDTCMRQQRDAQRLAFPKGYSKGK